MPSLRRSSLPEFTAALLAAALTVACGTQPSDLEQARQAGDDGDRPRAIGLYRRHLEAAPTDFDARLEYTLLLGEVWAFQGGDRAPIVENLDLLYAAAPGNVRVRELLAMMLVRDGQAALAARRFDDAEAQYLRAIDVQPDVGTASYHLGNLYEQWDRPDDAFAAWVAAALKRPPIPDLYLRLGQAYLQRGDLDRAINTLELVVQLRGTSTYRLPRARCALAQAYLQRGDLERARVNADEAGEGCSIEGLASQ